VGDNLGGMTLASRSSGGNRLRVVFDMTFPDRNRGGSGVYARSLLAALAARHDVEVGQIRSARPGLVHTARWLASQADQQLRVAGATLLHSPSFVVPWRVHVPFVVTVFDLSTRRFPGDHPLEWRAYERWFLPSRVRAAARVIAISELTRQDAIHEYGVAPERVVTVYPGVGGRFFRPPGAAGREPGPEPRLLFPGAPVARKNVELVLQAMAQAAAGSALARACLQISGAVAERFPERAARIQALGLSGRVQWLGQVSPEAMPGLMAAADVCVYPSLYEGFGFPPLEAMASGTPVVASTASCLPEVLGDAALLVDPTDVAALARALESVLTDPGLRARLVEAGRRRAADFTWDRCAEETMQVYRQALTAGAV
jgi:glycosyltransferase involved in cell wall biosynthesis